jgi:curli biogenesis system outer membrane secretion channel CsgG
MKKSRWSKIFFRILFAIMIIALGASCASKPDLKDREITLAVWDLDDLSPSSTVRPPLGEIFSSQIIEALKKKGDYTVVERERLLLALEELRLGTTKLVDETTRLKLGKMIGARFMVFGGYQIIGNQMRIDLRMVEVETGKVKRAVEKTTSSTDLQDWIDAAKKAAQEL